MIPLLLNPLFFEFLVVKHGSGPFLAEESREGNEVPLGVLGHCDGVKGSSTQAALSPRAAKGWGGLRLHRSLLPPSTLSPGHPQVHPLPVRLQPSQHDHSSPAWLWAVTTRVHLLRRKGPSLGSGWEAWAGWALLVPLSVPLSIPMPSAAWGCVFAKLDSCCPPPCSNRSFVFSDLLAAPPWADGGVFSEGEGPRGESHPMRALP